MGAENHHYVPKFVLRNFLSGVNKEHVSVYDKHTDKIFVTAIKNIMAERRFNEFQYDEFIVSFESVASKIEELILPRYQKIIELQKLEGTADEKADLAFLIAFQMLRVKAMRNQIIDLEKEITKKVTKLGHTMDQVKGWTPLTEDKLKFLHLGSMQKDIGKYAEVIADKVIMLARAARNRTFYISDNPVTLHDKLDFGPYGNLGLAVKGIEIYLPLSSELMLCALCPSIVADVSQRLNLGRNLVQKRTRHQAVQGQITFAEMTRELENFEKQMEAANSMVKSFTTGVPLSSDNENMDFYNSLPNAVGQPLCYR